MQKTAKIAACLLLLSMPLVMGCGKAGMFGEAVMEISEMGVSMNLPAGWRLDNPRMCHKGDNTCLLMEEGLEGQPFEACAAKMSKEFGSAVISESKLTINGHQAIKAVMNTPDGNKLLRVYIHKGDIIVVVSFVILKDEYPANESAVQQSIQSLKVKP